MNINAKDARQPGCSAEKRGRFIPCRGGGTATTYYTDVHDVDENLRTIVNPGGDWILGSMVGIMFREMRYDFTAVHATAASRLIYLS